MENPYAPQKDEALVVTHYKRTPQQAAMLGIEVTWRRCAPFLPRGAFPIAGGVVAAFCVCHVAWARTLD